MLWHSYHSFTIVLDKGLADTNRPTDVITSLDRQMKERYIARWAWPCDLKLITLFFGHVIIQHYISPHKLLVNAKISQQRQIKHNVFEHILYKNTLLGGPAVQLFNHHFCLCWIIRFCFIISLKFSTLTPILIGREVGLQWVFRCTYLCRSIKQV